MYEKIYIYSDSMKKEELFVLDKFNDYFNNTINDFYWKLPDKIGDGYLHNIMPNRSMAINIFDVNFNKEISFYEIAKTEYCCLFFCMSDYIKWRNIETNTEYFLEKDQFFVHKSYEFKTNNYFDEDKRYLSVNLRIDEKRFENIMNEYFSKNIISDFSRNSLNKMTFSPKTKLIIRDILNCNYKGSLRNLYIEGKVLELLTILASDLKDNNKIHRIESIINKSDLDSLNKIKQIIDENIVNPLTIQQLSKISFISQTKLKNNFKKVFGKTIYEYVIDSRMEKARQLLENSYIKVKEAASIVGYSNISHFSKNFKEKYGFTPSEYLKLEQRE